MPTYFLGFTASKIQRGQNGADAKKLGIFILSLILTEIYCLVFFLNRIDLSLVVSQIKQIKGSHNLPT
jgi:hypothetical protein